jgi:uncharacterized protein
VLTPVLVDTAALLALVNRRDQYHEAARRISAELAAARRLLIVSEWVLMEFLGGAARPPLRAAAIETVGRLRASRRVTVFPATTDGWQRSFELYRTRVDKDWSLVDCSSLLLCEHLGIQDVLTHDRHFTQAGLRVLLP